MKKTKLIFWLVVFGLIGLLLFQNRDFYLARQSIGIDLLVFEYASPPIPNAVLFVAFFFAGLLITYFVNLMERFKSRKAIKELTAAVASKQQTIADLRQQLAAAASEKPTAAAESDQGKAAGDPSDPAGDGSHS